MALFPQTGGGKFNIQSFIKHIQKITAPIVIEVIHSHEYQFSYEKFIFQLGFPVQGNALKYDIPVEMLYPNKFYTYSIEILSTIKDYLESKYPNYTFARWLKDKYGAPKVNLSTFDPSVPQTTISTYDIYIGKFWKNYHDYIASTEYAPQFDCDCHLCQKKAFYIKDKEYMKFQQDKIEESVIHYSVPQQWAPVTSFNKILQPPKTNLAEAVPASLKQALPDVARKVVRCPHYFEKTRRCEYSTNILDVVIHLNDTHHWKREDIADWTDTLDADLEFKSAEERAKEPPKEKEYVTIPIKTQGAKPTGYYIDEIVKQEFEALKKKNTPLAKFLNEATDVAMKAVLEQHTLDALKYGLWLEGQ